MNVNNSPDLRIIHLVYEDFFLEQEHVNLFIVGEHLHALSTSSASPLTLSAAATHYICQSAYHMNVRVLGPVTAHAQYSSSYVSLQ